MAWSVSANPVDPDEAIKWFRARVPMTADEFETLSDQAKRYAFSAAGATQLDVVTDLWRALDSAIANGTTFEDFKKAIGGKMTEAWGQADAGRLDNIFRTNVLQGYSAGRWQQMSDPVVRAARPLGRFSSVMESRTCPICAECNGVVKPLDDPWWDTHWPLLHGKCRCEVDNLREDEAKVTAIPPDVRGQEGFGGIPLADEWEPDLSTKPPEIAEIFRRRSAQAERPFPAEAPTPPVTVTIKPPVKQPQPEADPQEAVLRQAEAKIVGRKTEKAYLVSDDDDVLLEKVGKKHYVPFTDAEVKMMTGHVLTHNHPSGFTLSPDDLRLASTANLKAIRAVGHPPPSVSGKVTVYQAERPPNGWPPKSEISDAHNAALRQAKLKWDRFVVDEVGRARTPEERQRAYDVANHGLQREAMDATARRLGIRYTIREKEGA